nr:g-box-binding factor 4 [Quercus suber]
MASSKVVATTNPDLPRQSSICSLSTMLADLQQQQQQNQSMNMDDLLKNLYSTSSDQFADGTTSAGGGGGGAGGAGGGGDKTVDEVWKEIVAGTAGTTTNADNHSKVEEISGSNGNNTAEEMTLEDFLTKAGAVREEDFGMEVGFDGRMVVGGGGVSAVPVPVPVPVQVSVVGGGGGGGGRGKRRAIEEPLLDKATQQKQRRMIKNRESAARSRERKQAYTVELETLVTNLEEENAKLLKEEADHQKERFELLMQNLIPVVEKRKPRRALRRVNSVCW